MGHIMKAGTSNLPVCMLSLPLGRGTEEVQTLGVSPSKGSSSAAKLPPASARRAAATLRASFSSLTCTGRLCLRKHLFKGIEDNAAGCNKSLIDNMTAI